MLLLSSIFVQDLLKLSKSLKHSQNLLQLSKIVKLQKQQTYLSDLFQQVFFQEAPWWNLNLPVQNKQKKFFLQNMNWKIANFKIKGPFVPHYRHR